MESPGSVAGRRFQTGPRPSHEKFFSRRLYAARSIEATAQWRFVKVCNSLLLPCYTRHFLRMTRFRSGRCGRFAERVSGFRGSPAARKTFKAPAKRTQGVLRSAE